MYIIFGWFIGCWTGYLFAWKHSENILDESIKFDFIEFLISPITVIMWMIGFLLRGKENE